ncbi:NnrS family protein [Salinisphaera hydrothermalis]|uniref:NnrS family protein n=1 Tax=Salinisphaera hydrothermalis (strain C41B8) TaxID=1304275 RepID=A0A084IIP3_SALHC|nr:NnrS family protein [Salinisphaera hydrothermalis]KEZ76577.1 NnrS family protein [Salinisphaera hydrothermalis C41B8]
MLGTWDPPLLSAPHRLFFLLGGLQLVLCILFWLVVLTGLYIPAVPVLPLTVNAMSAHLFLMLYGLFIFFVFGFLLTVFPRWLDTAEVDRCRYALMAALLTVGMGAYYLGLFTSRNVALIGTGLFVGGWGVGLWTLAGIWRCSNRGDKRFALFPFGCVTLGGIGAVSHALWLWTSQDELLVIAGAVGLWLYLVPLVIVISYRMIPFFSSRVLTPYVAIKPRWTLPATLICVLAHFGLTLFDKPEWLFLCDLPLAAIGAWHSYRWGLWRSLRVPLLGMLHLSFAWLAVAMALYAIQSLLQWTRSPLDLGLAPLHALAIGFVTSMLVAMASRVSLGHSGRPLRADRITLWAFAAVQLATIARVLAEFPWPGHGYAYLGLVLAAALLWLAAFIPWGLHFGTIYCRPRVDGVPG